MKQLNRKYTYVGLKWCDYVLNEFESFTPRLWSVCRAIKCEGMYFQIANKIFDREKFRIQVQAKKALEKYITNSDYRDEINKTINPGHSKNTSKKINNEIFTVNILEKYFKKLYGKQINSDEPTPYFKVGNLVMLKSIEFTAMLKLLNYYIEKEKGKIRNGN